MVVQTPPYFHLPLLAASDQVVIGVVENLKRKVLVHAPNVKHTTKCSVSEFHRFIVCSDEFIGDLRIFIESHKGL